MAMASSISRGFTTALTQFKDGLTDKEKADFSSITTERDVWESIKHIQNKQATKGRMQDMGRIKEFIEGLSRYIGLVSCISFGTTNIGSFIWGPLRRVLEKASEFADGFVVIMKAFQRLGENLPRFEKYSELFKYDGRIQEVISWLYGDILQFYLGVLEILRNKSWRNYFKLQWERFGSRLDVLVNNIQTRQMLIDNEAQAAEIEAAQKQRQEEAKRQQRAERDNELKQIGELGRILNPTLPVDDKERLLERRCEGTGSWILEHDLITKWLNSELASVWVTGKPGSGKSVLSAVILERLEDHIDMTQKGLVLSYFCQGTDSQKNSSLSIIQSLVYQYIEAVPIALPYAYEEITKRRTTQGSLAKLFEKLLEFGNPDSPVFVLVDGLDELPPKDIEFLLKNTLRVTSTKDTRKRVLVLSRRTRDMEMCLKSKDTKWIIELRGYTDNDLEVYIKSAIEGIIEEHELETRNPQLATEIAEILVSKADGMFLWAHLVIEGLLKRRTIDELLETLKKLPTALTEVYSQILHALDNLEDNERALGHSILCWVAFAKRPLRVMELEDLLALRWSKHSINDARRPCSLQTICGPIVEFTRKGKKDGPRDVVTFIHFTVREFLLESEYNNTKKPYLDKSRCLSDVAGYSIHYQMFECFANSDGSRLQGLVLNGDIRVLSYMQRYWLSHVEEFFAHDRVGPRLQQHIVDRLSVLTRRIRQAHGPESQNIEDLRSESVNNAESPEKTRIPNTYDVAIGLLNSQSRSSDGKNILQLLRFYSQLFEKESTITDPADMDSWIEGNDPLGSWKSGLRLRNCLEQILNSPQVFNENSAQLERLYGSRNYFCRFTHCTRYHSVSGEGFENREDRDKHERTTHPKTYQCPHSSCLYSEKTMNSVAALQSHLRVYHIEKKLPDLEAALWDTEERGAPVTQYRSKPLELELCSEDPGEILYGTSEFITDWRSTLSKLNSGLEVKDKVIGEGGSSIEPYRQKDTSTPHTPSNFMTALIDHLRPDQASPLPVADSAHAQKHHAELSLSPKSRFDFPESNSWDSPHSYKLAETVTASDEWIQNLEPPFKVHAADVSSTLSPRPLPFSFVESSQHTSSMSEIADNSIYLSDRWSSSATVNGWPTEHLEFLQNTNYNLRDSQQAEDHPQSAAGPMWRGTLWPAVQRGGEE